MSRLLENGKRKCTPSPQPKKVPYLQCKKLVRKLLSSNKHEIIMVSGQFTTKFKQDCLLL